MFSFHFQDVNNSGEHIMRNKQYVLGSSEYHNRQPTKYQSAINQRDQFLFHHKHPLSTQLNTHEVITHRIVSIQPAAVVGSCGYGCKQF